MKEKPNTQLFFNNIVARIVPRHLDTGKAYWIFLSDSVPVDLWHLYFCPSESLVCETEEWRIANNLPLQPVDWTEEQWTLFKLRWL